MVNKGGGLVQWLTRVWAWCSGYHGYRPSAVVNKGGGLVQWVKNKFHPDCHSFLDQHNNDYNRPDSLHHIHQDHIL